jgi:hypothetical protein
MKRVFAAIFLYTLCAFASAQTETDQSAAPPQDVLVGVQWEERPTARSFADHYPPEALRRRIDGGAVLDCDVRDDRRLACRVRSEQPDGQGFGAAALQISGEFLAAPQTLEGRSVVGGVVVLPIMFRASPPPSFRPPPLNIQPLGRYIERHYPARARAEGVGGRASVRCVVAERRRWSCTAVSEDPAGYGFAEALIAIMNERALRPGRDSTVGDQTDITLTFAPRE